MKEAQQLRSPTALEAVGKTPIVQLQKIVPKGSADIFVKLEYFNPTGSYKDRMALSMIEEAEKRGLGRRSGAREQILGQRQYPLGSGGRGRRFFTRSPGGQF